MKIEQKILLKGYIAFALKSLSEQLMDGEKIVLMEGGWAR